MGEKKELEKARFKKEKQVAQVSIGTEIIFMLCDKPGGG